jgi:hypothetical protein
MRKSKYYTLLLLVSVVICITVVGVLIVKLLPSVLFQKVVLNPIPVSVRNIRVSRSVSILFKNHTYVLRFNVSKADLALILGSREFKEISYVKYNNGTLDYGDRWSNARGSFSKTRGLDLRETWWSKCPPRWFRLGDWKSFKAYMLEKEEIGYYGVHLLLYNEEQGESYFIDHEIRGTGIGQKGGRTWEEWQRKLEENRLRELREKGIYEDLSNDPNQNRRTGEKVIQ